MCQNFPPPPPLYFLLPIHKTKCIVLFSFLKSVLFQYEKRRYYSEAAERAARSSPSISSLSSNSSQDNKPLSSLIGRYLTSTIDLNLQKVIDGSATFGLKRQSKL